MTAFNLKEDDLGVEMFDISNPRSLFNILPIRVQEAAFAVPRKEWLRSESAITRSASPDFSDKCIRINFWQAYCKAQDAGKSININHIVAGVTTKDYFYHVIDTDRSKLIFYLTPPKAYDVMQRQILDESLERLREIVTSDLYNEKVVVKHNKDGTEDRTVHRTINNGLIAEIRKITEMLQNRVHGTLIQKVALKGEISTTPLVQATKSGELAPEQGLDALLQQINGKLSELPPVIEGEVDSGDII